MVTIDSNEAILFRLLVAFFGEDRVVPHMSLYAVCGGRLPGDLSDSLCDNIEAGCKKTVADWARENKCLFTIVNNDDDPRLVIEFVPHFDDQVDLDRLERQRYMRPFLEAAGVPLLTVSESEFLDLTRPGSGFDLMALLQSRFEAIELGSAD